MSSKPTTERSSGTRSPASRAASSTPSASWSVAAITAVGRGPADGSKRGPSTQSAPAAASASR